MATDVVHLSDVVRRPLVNASGERVGKIQDLIVRLGTSPHPPIVGAVVRSGGQDLFVPIDEIADLGVREVQFLSTKENLSRFERRPGELLLARDLLRRHLINMVGGRLIRAGEIELARVGERWEVVGVDASTRSALRQVLPLRLRRREGSEKMVDWATIEPLVAHVPTARLRIPLRKLARLHPAQIADLVEAASHEEGEEIIESLAADRELEADVFEELDPEHQVEFLEGRSDDQAARVLARMAPDDAADLIIELDQDRRLPILALLPQPQQTKVRTLLNYNPETAGGLMSPDFVSLPESTTVATALAAIAASRAPDEALGVVFVLDAGTKVIGTVSLLSLIRADRGATIGSLARQPTLAHVHPDWDLAAILRKMSDYNLTVAPVLDPEHHDVLGVVTVDDLLELLLPSGWRRDYGPAAAEA
jgi:CBS domain-containing protein